MFTVTVGFELSGNSSTFKPLSSRYSVMPSTEVTLVWARACGPTPTTAAHRMTHNARAALARENRYFGLDERDEMRDSMVFPDYQTAQNTKRPAPSYVQPAFLTRLGGFSSIDY